MEENFRVVDIATPSPPRPDDDLNTSRASNAPSVPELWAGEDFYVDGRNEAVAVDASGAVNMSVSSLVDDYRSDVSSDSEVLVVDVHSGSPQHRFQHGFEFDDMQHSGDTTASKCVAAEGNTGTVQTADPNDAGLAQGKDSQRGGSSLNAEEKEGHPTEDSTANAAQHESNFVTETGADGTDEPPNPSAAAALPKAVAKHVPSGSAGQGGVQNEVDAPSSSAAGGGDSFVLSSVKTELMDSHNVSTPYIVKEMEPAELRVVLHCPWYSDGSGTPVDTGAVGGGNGNRNYYPHVDTGLDKLAEVVGNRMAEDSYLMHELIVGETYLVLTNGLFWRGKLVAVTTGTTGVPEYTFDFNERTSGKGKTHFARSKVYPDMNETPQLSLKLDRKSPEVKRVNDGHLMRKGDVVKLLDGSSGVVFYNNAYTYRVMVFIERELFLLCYTQVVAFRREIANRDFSAKRYLEDYENTGAPTFDTHAAVEATGTHSQGRKRSVKKAARRCVTPNQRKRKEKTPKKTPKKLPRQRSPTKAAVVKQEVADGDAAPYNAPASFRAFSANQLVEVRAAIAEAARNVSAEVSQSVCGEVSKQVHDALFPVTAAALQLFTEQQKVVSRRQSADTRQANDRQSGSMFRAAAEEVEDDVVEASALNEPPSPILARDDELECRDVKRSLVNDFGACTPILPRGGFSPAETEAQRVSETLNATHHANDVSLIDMCGEDCKPTNESANFLTPFSPSKTPVLRKREANKRAAAQAMDEALNVVSKTKAADKAVSNRNDESESAAAKGACSVTETPKKKSPKKALVPAVVKKTSPRKASPKKQTPKKTSRNEKKSAVNKTPKKDECPEYLKYVEYMRRRNGANATPKRREPEPSSSCSSPLNESVTMSSVLSPDDVDAETVEEQDVNDEHQANEIVQENFVKMADVMVQYGKKGSHSRFDAMKIKQAILNNAKVLIRQGADGLYYVNAVRLDTGSAAWIAEANKGSMKATTFMRLAGEAAAKQVQEESLVERLNAYVTAFIDCVYESLPQPVLFADTFKDVTVPPATVEQMRAAFKEPFGTALSEGVKYLQPKAVQLSAEAFEAARYVVKRIVHRQTVLKSRYKAKR